MIYLDGIFSRYEDIHAIKEFKEELYVDLQEKLNDFKNQGMMTKLLIVWLLIPLGILEKS